MWVALTPREAQFEGIHYFGMNVASCSFALYYRKLGRQKIPLLDNANKMTDACRQDLTSPWSATIMVSFLSRGIIKKWS